MDVTLTPSTRRNAEDHPELGPPPTPMPRAVVCPYCGDLSSSGVRCTKCNGRFDHLSRQATQNAMGPWQIRDERVPTRPGCSFQTLKTLIERGQVRPTTVIRGPATRQFWMLAKDTPGVANLFGQCHNCRASVEPGAYMCAACGAVFEIDRDRQHLGLSPVRLLPGQADPEVIAASITTGVQTAAPTAGLESAPSAPVEVDDEALRRVPRLERRLAETRTRERVAWTSAAALLVAAAAAVLVRPAGPAPRPTTSTEEAMAAARVVPILGAGDVERVDEPAEARRPDEPPEVGPASTWDRAKQRVTELVKSGSSASLRDAIGLLDGLDRAGALPPEGVALRERLAERLDQILLRSIP